MRKLAILIGWLWVAVCVACWLFVASVDLNSLQLPPMIANWSVFALLRDSRFGLSFACIVATIPGAMLVQWGRNRVGQSE